MKRPDQMKPNHTQSSNDNDNLILSVETISNDTHLMGENEIIEPQEAISDDPTPEMTKNMQIQPCQLATYVHPIIGARGNRYTGGYSHTIAVLKHIDEIQKLTKGQVNLTELVQYIGKDPVNADGFGQYINHMLLSSRVYNCSRVRA